MPTSAPACDFAEWAEWAACSVKCGGGYRQRTRAGSFAGCPSETETETDPEDESCLVSSCEELVCDPPTCCVCGTEMPSDMRDGKVRSKDRIFVYRETVAPVTLASGTAVSLSEPGDYSRTVDSTWSAAAGMSTLPAGTKVQSYLIHVDSESESFTTCKIKFSTEVLGFQGLAVRASQDAFDASNQLLSPGTTFCTRAGARGCARHLENGDAVVFGADKQTVTVTSRSRIGTVGKLCTCLYTCLYTCLNPCHTRVLSLHTCPYTFMYTCLCACLRQCPRTCLQGRPASSARKAKETSFDSRAHPHTDRTVMPVQLPWWQWECSNPEVHRLHLCWLWGGALHTELRGLDPAALLTDCAQRNSMPEAVQCVGVPDGLYRGHLGRLG